MRILILLTALITLTAPAPGAEPQVFRASRLWPGDGPPIDDAVLVVRDGKVVAAGRRADVPAPGDARVIDLGEATIIPGLIAGESSLAEKGSDDLFALTPHYRAIDGFDWYADFSGPLSGGVTTAQLAPGAKRLLPGQGAVVKLFGQDLDRRTLRSVDSLRIVLGDAYKNPPRIYEPPVGAVSIDRPLDPTRPQLAGSQSGALAGLRAAFTAARADRDPRNPMLRSLTSVMGTRQPVRVTAPGAGDVQAAVTLAREFDLRLILVEPSLSADKLAGLKRHVDGIVLNVGARPGVLGSQGSALVPAEAARDLRAAGFRVALKPANDADLKEMLYLGSLFTSQMAAADVLRMLTTDAAALLGVGDRVGTLSAGKDADFVVLTGDPFALRTRIKGVYVDGEKAWSPKPAASGKIIRAARILTGNGEIIENGAVLVDGQTIRAVGREVPLPANAEEKNFHDAVIVPGFLDLGTTLGVGGPIGSPVAFNTRLGDRLAVGDSGMKAARQGGITTVLLTGPAPSPVLAYKLTDRPRLVKEPAALHFALRGNLTSAAASLREALRNGKSYADSWSRYEAELPAYEIKKKEFDAAQAKAAAEKKPEDKDAKKDEEKKPEPPRPPDKPQLNEALEPYRAMFAGKIPALVDAKREDAILLAITICRDEYKLPTVLVGADDAHRIPDLLAAKGVAVVTGPELVRRVDLDDVNLPLALSLHGVPFGFQSQAGGSARNLPAVIGFAVRHGLTTTDGLRGLSAGPARFLGLEKLGSIAAGKDADLVVLSGMPFEPSTRVLAVMIDGQWVLE